MKPTRPLLKLIRQNLYQIDVFKDYSRKSIIWTSLVLLIMWPNWKCSRPDADIQVNGTSLIRLFSILHLIVFKFQTFLTNSIWMGTKRMKTLINPKWPNSKQVSVHILVPLLVRILRLISFFLLSLQMESNKSEVQISQVQWRARAWSRKYQVRLFGEASGPWAKFNRCLLKERSAHSVLLLGRSVPSYIWRSLRKVCIWFRHKFWHIWTRRWCDFWW